MPVGDNDCEGDILSDPSSCPLDPSKGNAVHARFVDLAMRAADAAARVIRPYYRTAIEIDDKADRSPVTIADREAEAAMREIIEKEASGHGIIGEEFGPQRPEADCQWILDPIDGTKSFISGLPLFGVLIALAYRGVPVLGIIDQPISRERWLGGRGLTTTLNGKPARVRACGDLAQATLFSTDPEMFFGATQVAYQRFSNAVRLRRFGADCYAFGLLASGHIDLVCEAGMRPYDYAALVPIIEGAGGVITDWSGAPLTLESDGSVLAAGDARLHKAAQHLLTSKT